MNRDASRFARHQEAPASGMDLAEQVRAACLQAAVEAYEDAGLRGLCPEGRWECAIGAIRSLSLEVALDSAGSTRCDPPPAGRS